MYLFSISFDQGSPNSNSLLFKTSSLLFENITQELLDELKSGVARDIKFWLPYINMKEIIVENLADENRVNISFSFSIGETGANQIIILELKDFKILQQKLLKKIQK